MVYADEGIKPYLSKQGVMNLRSSFAKDIFAQDLYFVYEKETERRSELRQQSRELIAEIVSKINAGNYENPKLEEMLLQLADRLSKTGGKKQYGYLKADVKAMVNRIVDELASDEHISVLYNLWYEQREEVLRTYTETMPERVPLSQNKEFKSIRNAVVQEAMNIAAEHDPIVLPDEDAFTVEEPDVDELEKDEALKLSEKEKTSVMWKLYRKAKELLDKDSAEYNPSQAVKMLMESAGLGCGVAKYRLGKMFLRGEDVSKNVDYALLWLEESADEDNPYAEYLLGKTLFKGEDTKQDLIRAESLLRRSSEQHNKYASYTLGKALLDGDVLIQDIPEAIRLLTESADIGFLPAEYLLGKLLYHGEVVGRNIGKALLYLERAAEKENSCAAYLAGKIRLTEDGYTDVKKAVRLFQISASQGNNYAEYQLGKLYLYGQNLKRDYDLALRWLTASAEHGNQYAAQLLHSIKNNRNWFAAMGTLSLLHHISRMIRNRLEDERKGKSGAITDRKLRRKIQEKNEALGIKQG